MTIPTFRRHTAPKLAGEKDRKRERYRGSRQERGYDADWERLRDRYFKAGKGQCEECRRRGYLTMGSVVDHVEPVRDAPDKRLEWSNLQILCTPHHSAKYKMEEYARKTGQGSLLFMWVKHPETRPTQFQIVKHGPLHDLFDGNRERLYE